MLAERDRDKWLDRLYGYLREHFEQAREKEEQAILNKNASKRKGAVTPQELAQVVLLDLKDREPKWLRSYRDFFREVTSAGVKFESYESPPDGNAMVRADMLNLGVEFKYGKRTIAFTATKQLCHAELLALVANEDRRDIIRVPSDKGLCEQLLGTYSTYLHDRKQRLSEAIEERVADQAIQRKVHDLAMERLRYGQ